MSTDNSNVTDLGIRKKPAPSEDRTLLQVDTRACAHRGPYVVDESLSEVECATCHAKLNPMWVLTRMANRETSMERHRATYQDEMQRLAERKKTKCEHCRKMTRISKA